MGLEKDGVKMQVMACFMTARNWTGASFPKLFMEDALHVEELHLVEVAMEQVRVAFAKEEVVL